MRAGRGLQADVRQAADLRQRLLQQPHQLQRALGAPRVLGRVQAGVAGQRRDPLVQPRVVLHRAGAERVEAGVEVEVAAREAVVVADDLRLGDLRQARRLGAQQLRRDQLLERPLRARRRPAGRAARRPGFDFSKIVTRAFALHRGLGQAHRDRLLALCRRYPRRTRRARRRPRRRAPRRAVDLLAGAALGDRDQQAVLVLGVLAAERVAGGDAALGAALEHRGDRGVEPERELAHDRRLVQQLDALDRGQPLARVGGAPDQQLAQLAEALAAEPGEVDHRRRARSAPARCRCCGSPSRGGCAARGSAGRGRSRGGRRRPRSRRRSGPACGGCAPRWRRRSRTRGRRSRAGCRAAGPRRGRCRRRTRRAA